MRTRSAKQACCRWRPCTGGDLGTSKRHDPDAGWIPAGGADRRCAGADCRAHIARPPPRATAGRCPRPAVAPGRAGTGRPNTRRTVTVNELVEAADDRTLAKTIARHGRLELLCLDELGYLHLDPRGAELLFQILTEREERASVAVASNAPFSEWGATFTDPRLAAAVVDRLTFNAHILETATTSYRLRSTTTTKGTAPTP